MNWSQIIKIYKFLFKALRNVYTAQHYLSLRRETVHNSVVVVCVCVRVFKRPLCRPPSPRFSFTSPQARRAQRHLKMFSVSHRQKRLFSLSLSSTSVYGRRIYQTIVKECVDILTREKHAANEHIFSDIINEPQGSSSLYTCLLLNGRSFADGFFFFRGGGGV